MPARNCKNHNRYRVSGSDRVRSVPENFWRRMTGSSGDDAKGRDNRLPRAALAEHEFYQIVTGRQGGKVRVRDGGPDPVLVAHHHGDRNGHRLALPIE